MLCEDARPLGEAHPQPLRVVPRDQGRPVRQVPSDPRDPGAGSGDCLASTGRVTLSVVIPTLDESARIAARLRELAALSVEEIVVVDGGSRDGTADVARAHGGVRVVVTPRGRGQQLNAGARDAR